MWLLCFTNGPIICCADDLPAFYLARFVREFPQFEIRQAS